MLKKIIQYSFLFLSFFVFSQSFAIEFDGDITLKEATSNSLEISFNEVEGSAGYYLEYGEKSGKESGYDFDGEDIYETNDILIKDLKPDTTYFLAVTVLSEEGEEGTSEEFSFKTLAEGEVTSSNDSLEIELISIEDTRTIRINFNKDLNTESNRDFLIVNKEDETKEILIENDEIENGNSVVLTLGEDLKIGGEYSITIVELLGINGENIKSGVDGIEDFSVPMDTPSFGEVSQNSEENETTELNSAGQEPSVAGTNISDDDIAITPETVDTENLPDTGPEQWILLILAFLLGITVFFVRKKSV